MADDSITAVIPVHSRADLLARLLTTLRAQTTPFAEVLAIDNASTDNAAEVAREGGCRVIAMGRNLGFARAVNCGWRAASTPWVAILNSDVELDSQWLERLLAAVGSSSFATGTILSAGDRGTIDGTYDLMSRGACAWRAGNGTPVVGPGAPQPIAIAPGTACLFRREVLERLGGFDETFGSYLEDVDLGLRCLREGFTGVYIPDALAWHHGSATWGRWNRQVVRAISRNQVLLVARHYDRALVRSCCWPIVAGQLLWGVLALRHGAGLDWAAGKWEALGSLRREGWRPEDRASPRLRDFLIASEREIRSRAQGPYWRWYFRLTGPEKTAAH